MTINTLLLVCLLVSCVESKKPNMDEVVLRIHTPEMEVDWYEEKGRITTNEFIKSFSAIDWKSSYWKEWNNETFNPHSIEAFNKSKNKYLGISVCPNTPESYQFYLAYGEHIIIMDSVVSRKVKLYYPETDNPDYAINFIDLFFSGDIEDFEKELSKIDFFEEIDDLYQNLNGKNVGRRCILTNNQIDR